MHGVWVLHARYVFLPEGQISVVPAEPCTDFAMKRAVREQAE